MVEYLRDLDVDGEDIHLDSTNDLALSSGIENLEQSTLLSARNATKDLIGEPINANSIRELEEVLRGILNNDPHIDTVIDVSLTNIEEEADLIEVDIKLVDNEEFTIELNRPEI